MTSATLISSLEISRVWRREHNFADVLRSSMNGRTLARTPKAGFASRKGHESSNAEVSAEMQTRPSQTLECFFGGILKDSAQRLILVYHFQTPEIFLKPRATQEPSKQPCIALNLDAVFLSNLRGYPPRIYLDKKTEVADYHHFIHVSW